MKKGKITNVKSHQTTDGRVFTNKLDALNHQFEIDFAEWYEEHKIYGQYDGSYASSETVLEWLSEHKEHLKRYFSLLV
jgi:hypothetical protein